MSKSMITKGNKNKCWYCGQEEECTKDHFYPKSKGGTLCVYACKVCQRTKGDLTPEQWIDYIKNHVAFDKDIKIRIINATQTLIDKGYSHREMIYNIKDD